MRTPERERRPGMRASPFAQLSSSPWRSFVPEAEGMALTSRVCAHGEPRQDHSDGGLIARRLSGGSGD